MTVMLLTGSFRFSSLKIVMSGFVCSTQLAKNLVDSGFKTKRGKTMHNSVFLCKRQFSQNFKTEDRGGGG